MRFNKLTGSDQQVLKRELSLMKIKVGERIFKCYIIHEQNNGFDENQG